MRVLISEKLSPHKYKTQEGYLICQDSILARTGKQDYRRREVFGDSCDDADEVISIDRPEEEVFSDKTLASFENKPITIEHPDEDVNVANYKTYSVGFVRDIKRGVDNGKPVMIGTLVITDQEAIDDVESGKLLELSCGYDCDISDEDHPCQRNIRGNHIALCEQGRAGNARIIDSVKDEKSTYTEVTEELEKGEKDFMKDAAFKIGQKYKQRGTSNVIHIDLIHHNGYVSYSLWTPDNKLGTSRVSKTISSEDFAKMLAKENFIKDSMKDEDQVMKFANNKLGKQFVLTQQEDGSVIVKNEWGQTRKFESMKKAEEVLRSKGFTIYDDLDEDLIEDKLIESGSEEALKKNIATEIESGKDPKQAAAIAYSVQRANDAKQSWTIMWLIPNGDDPDTGTSVVFASSEELAKEAVKRKHPKARIVRTMKGNLGGEFAEILFTDSVQRANDELKTARDLKEGTIILHEGKKYRVTVIRKNPFGGYTLRLNTVESPVKTEEIYKRENDPVTVVDSVKDDFDKQYALEYKLLDADIKMAKAIFEKYKNKSASDIFKAFGYIENMHQYTKQKGDYTRVINFYDFDDIRYFVLKDGKIPQGWTVTRTRWLDSLKDGQHEFEICYFDNGLVCIAIQANNKEDAVRKFRRNYGAYTIKSIRQTDTKKDSKLSFDKAIKAIKTVNDFAYRPYRFSTKIEALERAIEDKDLATIKSMLPSLKKDMDDFEKWKKELTENDKKYYEKQISRVLPALKRMQLM